MRLSLTPCPVAGGGPPPSLKDAIESVYEAFTRPVREQSISSIASADRLVGLGVPEPVPPPPPPPPPPGRHSYGRDPDGYGLGPSHPDDYADLGRPPRRSRSRSPRFRSRSRSPRRYSPYRHRPRSRSRSPPRRSRSPWRRGYDSPPRRSRWSPPRDRRPPSDDRRPPFDDRRPPYDDRRRMDDRPRDPYDRPRDPYDRPRSPHDRHRDRYDRPRDPFSRSRSPYSRPREVPLRSLSPSDRPRWPGDRVRSRSPGLGRGGGVVYDRPRGPGGGDERFRWVRPGAVPQDPGSPTPRAPPAPPAPPANPPAPPQPEPLFPTVNVKDLLQPPGRLTRPSNLVIILRGPPGSGKTYTAKLIKDQEVANKGSAPRILSLDDYFCTEKEKTVTDPDTGKKVTKKVMEYEYDAAVEESYRVSLRKVFRKTVDEGFFHFIIVDCVNARTNQYDEMCSYASARGFKVRAVVVGLRHGCDDWG
ncbi:YLP motif-containing protein 1 [Amphibalanus amphitrite]|uniref:YLP motif-containing protein 1 n=1 Tax=Amphibalanus amphitrite TaxID=1232801 RepID=A0A6A4W5R7_AMPAM|nr:YLP motif-containing protein 1 [Amphibalanus amphitrite]